MTWDFYGDGEDFVYKAKKEEAPKDILSSLDNKGKETKKDSSIRRAY